jgi:tetratricopeptide (TPR) repeat protein
MRIGPSQRIGRPNARQLAYFEGLMRALEQSTEDEMDSGQWEKTVSTSSGMTTIRLRLPGVLADEAGDPSTQSGLRTGGRSLEKGIAEIQRFMATQNFSNIEEAEAAIQSRFLGRSIDSFPSTAATPLERAQEIMYDAFEARGRTKIKLARRALAISPDCADAYGLLAARTNNMDRARDLLMQGVAAGERAVRSLGIDAGKIGWGDVRCRPYLRARFALAEVLKGFGEVDDAVREFVDILRTDPDDHQGVRYELLTLLLTLGKDREAHALLEKFPSESGALWPYARALLAHRQEGGSAEADQLADRALKANPFMWKFLAGTQDLPFDVPEAYRPGSREEAIVFAEDLAQIWQDTPGAAEWIRTRGRSRSKEKSGAGKSGAGGRGKSKGPKKKKPR